MTDKNQKRPPSGDGIADKRRKVLSDLASIRGVTKTALSKTLHALQERGLLVDNLVTTPTLAQYHRGVRSAIESHGLQTYTPYGQVIQELDLPCEKMPRWHYLNPFAFVWHLCSINQWLFNLVAATARNAPGGVLSIIVYIDEINPGNPLHPELGRLIQAIYWTFADFPLWFIRRKASWFTFGLLRSAVVKDMRGYISELLVIVLKVFFGSVTHDSWERGCTIQHGDRSTLLFAKFAGFLADEKGLKEIFDIKGQGGSIPCFTCLNIRNRWVECDGTNLLHMWDPARDKVKHASDKHIKVKVRKVTEAHATGNATFLATTQTALGINYNPQGLLWCAMLMNSVLHPTSNYIRDWMHTLASNGVVGTHIALITKALADIGCPLSIVRAYAKKFTLPRSRGRVSDMYFKDELVMTDHVRHFASDVVGMVPLLFAFLIEKASPRGWIPRNITCFSALHAILCILRRGAITPSIADPLRAVILRHAQLWIELYGNTNCKVKFHHLYDLVDDMLRLGKAVSCFVTERKHKDVLAVADSVSRHLERTTTCAFLQNVVSHWRDNMDACRPCYLNRAKQCTIGGETIICSEEAVLQCGTVFRHDMVLLQDGSVAQVVDFFLYDDDGVATVLVRVDRFAKSMDGPLYFRKCLVGRCVLDSDELVEPVAWYSVNEDTIAVALPIYE